MSAFLADRVEFPDRGVVPNWNPYVVRPLRAFTAQNVRTLWILKRLLPWNWARSTVAVAALERQYRKKVAAIPLGALPVKPRYVYCATDLAFAVNWVFERSRVGDYQAGYGAPPKEWGLARAVAASSCFPPVFDPQPIDLAPGELKDGAAARDPARREERDRLVRGLRLSDGGVYDNLGLEPVWRDHRAVFVSDGGGVLRFAPDRGFPRRLGRYLTVVENQSASLRKRWLMAGYLDNTFDGSYWGIGSAPTSYDASAPGYPKPLVDEFIATIRTDLDAFSDAEQAVLENHGYLLADAAVRVHAPDFVPAVPPGVVPPHPEWMDEDRVRNALRGSSKRKLLGRWRRVRMPKRQLPEGRSAETDSLLRRWSPVIQYDSGERYFADSVAALTDLTGGGGHASSLKRADGNVLASAAPGGDVAKLTLDFLGATEYATRAPVQATDFIDLAGHDYEADARRMHADPFYADEIYGHARHDPEGKLWLQYWFFHLYNDKALLGIGLHEGDWEMIQLRLEGEEPDVVTYAQHRSGQRAPWSEVAREETEQGPVPVVYSALGSHASHLRPGAYPTATVDDHNDGDGWRVRPRMVPLSDDGPAWALWPGRWGGTLSGSPLESDSPTGPHQHGQWWDPLAFHERARAD